MREAAQSLALSRLRAGDAHAAAQAVLAVLPDDAAFREAAHGALRAFAGDVPEAFEVRRAYEQAVEAGYGAHRQAGVPEDGVSDVPALAGVRRVLIQARPEARFMAFTRVEGDVRAALAARDLTRLEALLAPHNVYGRAVFEHDTGVKVARGTAGARRAVRRVLGEAAFAAALAREEDAARVAAARRTVEAFTALTQGMQGLMIRPDRPGAGLVPLRAWLDERLDEGWACQVWTRTGRCVLVSPDGAVRTRVLSKVERQYCEGRAAARDAQATLDRSA